MIRSRNVTLAARPPSDETVSFFIDSCNVQMCSKRSMFSCFYFARRVRGEKQKPLSLALTRSKRKKNAFRAFAARDYRPAGDKLTQSNFLIREALELEQVFCEKGDLTGSTPTFFLTSRGGSASDSSALHDSQTHWRIN